MIIRKFLAIFLKTFRLVLIELMPPAVGRTGEIGGGNSVIAPNRREMPLRGRSRLRTDA